ncbi:MAG: hypothetical protein Q9200_005303 [Gallowayella weberi]
MEYPDDEVNLDKSSYAKNIFDSWTSMRNEGESATVKISDGPTAFSSRDSIYLQHCDLLDQDVLTIQSSTKEKLSGVITKSSRAAEHEFRHKDLHEMSDANRLSDTEATADVYDLSEEKTTFSAIDELTGRTTNIVEEFEHDDSYTMFIPVWGTGDIVVTTNAFHALEKTIAPRTADAGERAVSRSTCHPFQPSLGTLSLIPPEIRSEIWQQLFLHAVPKVPKARPQVYGNLSFGITPQENRELNRVLEMLQAKGTI